MATAILSPTEVQASSARIATLDGWRGVAILLVLLEHAGQYGRFQHSMWTNLGSFGVDIFFVLSGYIITTRLIEERSESSTISLRSFYFRRAFRILPLVVTYLVALCMVSLLVNLGDFRSSELAGALLFFRNYQFAAHPQGIYTAHFWSLSIEEHFYLLWPALLLWLGNRRALWLGIMGAVTCGAWRLYDFTHPSSMISRMIPSAADGLRILRTDVRADGLLLGAALALLLAQPSVRSFIFRTCPKEAPLLAGFLLFLCLRRNHGYPAFTTYLLIALMIAASLVVDEGLAHKWLNFRPLVWVGSISYSLYIWQQLFLLHPVGARPLGALNTFPANIVCVFAVSACSYYFLERPAIAFGKRVYASRSSATRRRLKHRERIPAQCP